MVKVVLQCVSVKGAPKKPDMGKEAEHWESWFLPAVKDKVARIGRAVIDKCIDVDIFLAKCVNIF